MSHQQEAAPISPKCPDFLCYYFRDTPSFCSVLDRGTAEARRFLMQNDRDWRSQEDYLPFRIKVESWLRAEFIRRGGRPVRQNPLCLSLGPELVLENYPDFTGKILIPLSLFRREQISFTYADSMHTAEGRRPKIFMKDEIEVMVERFGTGYTEAQVWDDIPLEPIRKEYLSTGRLSFL